MTTRTLWIATGALSLAVAACDLLTETPRSFTTEDRFYKTPADVRSATFAAYQPLGTDDLYRWWLWLTLDLASDQVRMHPDEPNYQTYHPEFMRWDATTPSVTAPWNGLNNIVYRANLVLGRAPGVTFPDAGELRQLLAEAKFLRGYAYLLFSKLYDGVPLLLTEADHNNLRVSRTPVAQVEAEVVKDLTEAEADLPATRPLSELGRVTKGAAQMALADLYLWRSSYRNTGEWQLASDWAKKVIDGNVYGLNDDYLSTFLPANHGNKEMIFVIPSSGVIGGTSMNLGCLILPRVLGFGTGGGCEVIGQPTDGHYQSYLAGDYRHAVTYRTSGTSTDPNVGFKTFTWPNVYKYRPTNGGVGGPADTDFPVYRYAETLLMYAEAQNELGNATEAVTYLNLIRARARKGNGTEPPRPSPADYTGATDPVSLRDAIYQERDWELAHEAKRWFDLVRLDVAKPGVWATSLWSRDPIDPTATLQRDTSAYKQRWPLPQTELQVNPSLTQNPGY
jgi:starch-binding outer membrane protein, SusD/RagB family